MVVVCSAADRRHVKKIKSSRQSLQLQRSSVVAASVAVSVSTDFEQTVSEI